LVKLLIQPDSLVPFFFTIEPPVIIVAQASRFTEPTMPVFFSCKTFFCRYGLVTFFQGSLFLLAACSGLNIEQQPEPEKPISFFTGKPSGAPLSEFLNGSKTSDVGLPVNALLWRAALDIASFVPLDDVDTFGGSIVTEWHQPKANPKQRLKLTFFVVGREVRSDAITVHAYIQNRLDTEWVDAGRDEALGHKLENLVLTRARELRAAVNAQTIN